MPAFSTSLFYCFEILFRRHSAAVACFFVYLEGDSLGWTHFNLRESFRRTETFSLESKTAVRRAYETVLYLGNSLCKWID